MSDSVVVTGKTVCQTDHAKIYSHGKQAVDHRLAAALLHRAQGAMMQLGQ
jgi:hypothetical protein